MTTPLFIPDGYTLEATIPETQWYREIKIQYRPALPDEVAVILGRIRHLMANGTESGILSAEKASREAIKNHLVWWDQHPDVDSQEFSALLPNMENHLQAKLFNVVMGSDVPDDAREAAEKN